MLKLAVVGKDVSFSLSPQIHGFIAERTGNSVSYDKISLPQEDFPHKIKKILKEYDGINVTVPYKLAVIPYLSELKGDAALFGSVNAVRCPELSGYNADGAGFMMSLGAAGISASGKTALVLGMGGAGRSVAASLARNGAEVSVYDRHFEKSLAAAKDFGVTPLERAESKPYYLIVNATGTGSGATVGCSPVSAEIINLCTAATDLIYFPVQSEFLQIARGCGKITSNGLGMLFFQAYLSQCIFCGRNPSKEEASALFKEYLRSVK